MRTILALLALAALPTAAQAQDDDETIYLEPELPLEFNLTVDVASGTEEVICYQEPLEPVAVGSLEVDAAGAVVVPISIPDPVVRCTACNQAGCSEFSPNRGLVAIRQSHRFDFNNDGVIDVSDIVDWSHAIYAWIMTQPPGGH